LYRWTTRRRALLQRYAREVGCRYLHLPVVRWFLTAAHMARSLSLSLSLSLPPPHFLFVERIMTTPGNRMRTRVLQPLRLETFLNIYMVDDYLPAGGLDSFFAEYRHAVCDISDTGCFHFILSLCVCVCVCVCCIVSISSFIPH
jgi:hypothetical protein